MERYPVKATRRPMVMVPVFKSLTPNQKTTMVPSPHDISTDGQNMLFIRTALMKEFTHSRKRPRNSLLARSSAVKLWITLIPEKFSCVKALVLETFRRCTIHRLCETTWIILMKTKRNGKATKEPSANW